LEDIVETARNCTVLWWRIAWATALYVRIPISNLRYLDWEERIGRPTLIKNYSKPVYIVEDVATPTKLGGNGGICCKDNIEVEQF
jgi:hypothetical protein